MAVNEVDLGIPGGEVYGFLGPNGAGKTTVVRMLTTLLLPTSGSASVAGYDVVGHPTGRLLLRRDPYRLDIEQVLHAAARTGVAMEINSQVHRLDLSDMHARLARARGVKLVISTDAHAPAGFDLLRWGVTVARRAWAEPNDVLNTQPLETFRASLRRHKNGPST